MMQRVLLLVVTLVSVAPGKTYGIDHKNLDENHPLRIEDAYPVASGEIAIEVGGGFTVQRDGANRGFFPIEILYGALPNLQLGVGTMISTDPGEIEEQAKSGDLKLSGLYNFNQETLNIPALAVKLEVNIPTGVKSRGVDVELKGIVTKSIERLSFHFNGGYAFLNGTQQGERNGRYEFALGASYPIGAPHHTRTTLVADVFTEQAVRRRASNIVGTELGLRYQLTPRIVWDVGVGTEFAGPADRSRIFFTTGFSFGF